MGMATKPLLIGRKGVLLIGLGMLGVAMPKFIELSPDWAIIVALVGTSLVVLALVDMIGNLIRGRRTGSAVRLEIRDANIMGDTGVDSAQIALNVVAQNNGVPTTLRDWALEVALQGDQTTLRADYLSLSLAGDMVYTNQIIRHGDGLDEKTSNTRIISGGQATGRLLFALRGANRVQVARDDTSFVLSATDISGKKSTTTQSVGALAAIGKTEGHLKKK